MILTEATDQALEFLWVSARLGLRPVVTPALAREGWQIETRDPALGAALWELLDWMPAARIQWHDVTVMADCLAAEPERAGV